MDDNDNTAADREGYSQAAKNHILAAQAIFHSDRGSNLTHPPISP